MSVFFKVCEGLCVFTPVKDRYLAGENSMAYIPDRRHLIGGKEKEQC